MKILFLANRIPYPPYRGDKLKIFNLAKRLSGKHELHLLTFTETREEERYRPELEKLFKEVELVYLPKWKSALSCLRGIWNSLPIQVLYFQSAAMRRRLREVLAENEYDAIHVQHLRMAPYLSKRKDLKRILDLPDAYSLYWERRKEVKRGFLTTVFENIEQKRVMKYERVLKDYQLSLVCSREDLEYLRKLHDASNIRLLPNGVDLKGFSYQGHDYSHNRTLLFTGNMDYAPNVDAVVHFAKEIFPLVQERFPEVEFVIAGQRPVDKVKALETNSIKVTGFIKDLSEMYEKASVVVSPLRFGAGTQNKVLEAMAMGVSVVCSNIGFAGLGVDNGVGAFMETEAAGFADRVCQLLALESLREETGQKGLELIRRRFDWDIIAEELEGYFQELQ